MSKLNFFQKIALAGMTLSLITGGIWYHLKSNTIPNKTQRIRVVSFNLLVSNDQKPHPWAERKQLMLDCIRKIAPDIMGTQEGLFTQIKELSKNLSDYDWIGLGRRGGSNSEYMAIFYRKARFEPLAYDHFWLSDTPDVIGSATWGNRCKRMVTWIRFLDNQTQKEFYCFNTHLDHESEEARKKSAELIRKKIEELKTDLPIILMGDFNDRPETAESYKILTGDSFLTDTWNTAVKRHGESVGTCHHFQKPDPNGKRIDWILTRGNITVEEAEIDRFSKEGQFPSDHYPYVTHLKVEAR